jgi:hypothetical protein
VCQPRDKGKKKSPGQNTKKKRKRKEKPAKLQEVLAGSCAVLVPRERESRVVVVV